MINDAILEHNTSIIVLGILLLQLQRDHYCHHKASISFSLQNLLGVSVWDLSLIFIFLFLGMVVLLVWFSESI